MSEAETPGRDLTIDVRRDASVVLFPDDDDPRHDLINTSWYVKRSANLPHLGDEADHQVIEQMTLLRRDLPVPEDE
jgi:hypothetical protein